MIIVIIKVKLAKKVSCQYATKISKNLTYENCFVRILLGENMYYKAFYNENKKLIDDVGEKIIKMYQDYEKTTNADFLKKMSEEQAQEFLNKEPAFYEQHVVYEIYQNGYDPRAGRTLAVYLPTHFDRDFILSSCKSLFGEFSERDKKGCKNSNYREYREGVVDLVFKEEVDYRTSLNLIFTQDLPWQAGTYITDFVKYFNFLNKAPKGVIY